MIELIILFVILTKMAKGKPRRRRVNWSAYMRGSVNTSLSLGTLAAATLVSVVLGDAVTETTKISSVRTTWSMTDFTGSAGDGPISVGWAHSDYTDAEIEEYVETVGSWEAGDLVESREIGKRLIRRVGTFASLGGGASETSVLNDGKPIRTKLNWILNTGQTLRMWAYNEGTSALATTVPIVRTQGHANLWKR